MEDRFKRKRSKVPNKYKKIRYSLGYQITYAPRHPVADKTGKARVHRMIVYDAGLLVDLSMEVHHVNGIKTDNRLENLQVLTKSEHASLTWKGVKRSEAGNACKFCATKTRSKYGLCRKHYKLEWQRNRKTEHPELLEKVK